MAGAPLRNEDRGPMGKVILFLLLAIVAAAVWSTWPHLRARMPDDFQKLNGEQRVEQARKARENVVRQRCAAVGLKYPPREIFLRAFKREAQLEVWAREDAGPFRLLATHAVLAASGAPGPKRREGDRQVPEGCYRIERFNPESRFHLSLGLDYPNAADRLLSDRARPGGDIFIHGKDVSIGCLAMGDEAIEELYILALDVRQGGQKDFPVHIFPGRMSSPDWERFSSGQRLELVKFWSQLHPIFEAFERSRQVPDVSVDPTGSYLVR